ncbi:bacteriophage holin [Clostridium puniceum]|uniref:Bacteriophage holin n=1 Tax=Clostridium puniceum TaxID=29367 RepID=A0A1S8TAQ5_9CLOT|nr:phage holin [Clostridium puniceum]OOM74826.1 bacteriophage holin [Clostridium puniceum]
MISIDLKARLKNKSFWVAMTSAIAILLQQLGLNIIPSNYTEIVNAVLIILTMIGIAVDTSTTGISDQTTTITKTENDQVVNSTEDTQ